MADNGRKMIYPLTFAQEIRYFPFRFHWKHMPIFKECFIAYFLFVMPMAFYAERASKSPGNVKNYERYLEKEREEAAAHRHHLEGYYEDQHKH